MPGPRGLRISYPSLSPANEPGSLSLFLWGFLHTILFILLADIFPPPG